MFELIIYSMMNLLLGLVAIPWLLFVAVPLMLFLLALGAIVFAPVLWLIAKQRASEEIRVLLVDDSPNTLMLIKSILRSKNCALKIVDSGLKAIEELSREKYDLMILDYFMPGLNGSETLSLADRAINERSSMQANYQIPVVEYSSGKEESISTKPMNHFTLVGKLSKGMPPSRLKPLISQILNEVSGVTA
jgi:CheY-like chemotaxis protein